MTIAYPSYSSYNYSLNNPISIIDKNGKWPSWSLQWVKSLDQNTLTSWVIMTHEEMISQVFDNVVSKERLNGMINAQADIDKRQAASDQYMHAMNNETKFWKFLNNTENTIGERMHAIMDYTSPSHEGFQFWPDDPGLVKLFTHTLQELRPFARRWNYIEQLMIFYNNWDEFGTTPINQSSFSTFAEYDKDGNMIFRTHSEAEAQSLIQQLIATGIYYVFYNGVLQNPD